MNTKQAQAKSKTRKKAALTKQHAEVFFKSQILVMTILDQVRPDLDEPTAEICGSAMYLAGQALDNLLGQFPEFKDEIQTVVATFKNKAKENVQEG
jgi:hypothetical protein